MSLPDVPNGVMVVKVYCVQPEGIKSCLIHTLNVCVVICDTELEEYKNNKLLILEIKEIRTCCSQTTEFTGFNSGYWWGV